MSQFTAVPGASKDDFDTLSDQITTLNSNLSRLSNPTYCASKAQIDAALWETVNLGTTNFRILVINNSSKDDAFTSMANTATGILLVFEAYSIWNDHPHFIYLAGNNEMYIGTATVTQNGTTIHASNKMTHN